MTMLRRFWELSDRSRSRCIKAIKCRDGNVGKNLSDRSSLSRRKSLALITFTSNTIISFESLGNDCHTFAFASDKSEYYKMLNAKKPNPPPLASPPPLGIGLESSDQLALNAEESFSKKDFRQAEKYLTTLLAREPYEMKWYEARAQVRVDAKLFEDALKDYSIALKLMTDNINSTKTDRARLLSARALAYEGESKWQEALYDYNTALELASEDGRLEDPYVLNSRGNVKSSLGMYEDARKDYLLAAEGFRQAKGFIDVDGRSNQRLNGEVYACTNAALMLSQFGNTSEVLREMQNIARRAPYLVDIHVALASMYWEVAREEEAETQWEFACEKITTGCKFYRNLDWVKRIRRWPPSMVLRLQNFLEVNDKI